MLELYNKLRVFLHQAKSGKHVVKYKSFFNSSGKSFHEGAYCTCGKVIYETVIPANLSEAEAAELNNMFVRNNSFGK